MRIRKALEWMEGPLFPAPRKYEFNAYNRPGGCYTVHRIEVAPLMTAAHFTPKLPAVAVSAPTV